jgi:iron complex outermembrane receptor protein
MAPYVRSSSDTLTSNGPTTPDSMGNPNLKPELAKGVDLAFERYLSDSGVLSASLFYRHIENLTRNVVSYDIGMGRWISMPQNIGTADTEGIEFDGKFKLNQMLDSAPDVSVRTNVSFFNSQVTDIIGPYNRLDQQPHMTGNLGMDYRVRQIPLTIGGNLNVTPAYYTQTSNEQVLSVSQKRVVDVYALWRVDPKTSWRLTLSNLDPLTYTTGNVYNSAGDYDNSTTANRSYVNVQLRFEKKL